MGERRGTKALELWCRRITDGYPGVNVQNMTTSWRDGLAFCAMIHHFRPDLIDFNSLNKDDVYGNNELAFRTAEQQLGIPALLDAEDMASCSVPDRLSILTYLSQFYQTFGGSSPSRLAMSRTTETADDRIAPVPESPKQKVVSRLGMRRDPCTACGLPVFLAEKLVVSRTPYHRTCFRCARCSNQLTPGNYYETEEGQYCCETCPDEVSSLPPTMHQKYNEEVVTATTRNNIQEDLPENTGYKRSLSDEEKSGRKLLEISKSKLMESGKALGSKKEEEEEEEESARRLEFHASTVPDLIAQTSQMRLNFMASHLLSEKENRGEVEVVDGGRIEESASASERDLRFEERETAGRINSALPDDDEDDEDDDDDEEDEEEEEENEGAEEDEAGEDEEESNSLASSFTGSMRERVSDVNNAIKNTLDIKCDEEHKLTAIPFHDVVASNSVSLDIREDDTKELAGKADEREDTEKGLTLVQKRLRMFEIQDRKDHVGKERIERITPQTKSAFEVRELNVQSVKRSENNSNEKKNNPSLCLDVPISQEIKNQSESQNTDESIGTNSKPSKLDGITAMNEKLVHISKNDSNNERESIVVTKESNAQKNISEKSPNGAAASSERQTVVPLEENKEITSHRVPVNVQSNKDGTSVDSVKETSLTRVEGIDLSTSEDYPEHLNPFKSDDEENATDKYHTAITSSKKSGGSTNPFDSADDDDDDDYNDEKERNKENQTEREVVRPKPAARINVSNNNTGKLQPVVEVPAKRRLIAPKINLNPFWSDDDEEHDSDLESRDLRTPANAPVAKPRTIKHTPDLVTAKRISDLSRTGLYASNSSIASSESATTPSGTHRKKKPAPQPPAVKELFPSDQRTSPQLKTGSNSAVGYKSTSPRSTTPRARKSKPAPPPPMPTSTPYNVTMGPPLNFAESPITEPRPTNDNHNSRMWEDQKTNKDEANRNRQSLTSISCEEGLGYKSYMDKSAQGKWKRKKGPAPPRPIPHRRKIKVISMKDVKLELDEIELQQQGLERQGVRLEQLIRDKSESGNKNEDSSLGMDVEELVLELFALVNEKNELFRRQAELMLLRRQQRLEEEHAEVEYQIRCLMSQPEATKTDYDKQREESLIQRLVEIVERRNEIVECLEMDRRREVEEDRSIHKHMGLYAARNKNEIYPNNNDSINSSKTKKGKTKEKLKDKKSKKSSKKDADKDVDETEVKLKRHTKRKWF